jgi:hypothetical protein
MKSKSDKTQALQAQHNAYLNQQSADPGEAEATEEQKRWMRLQLDRRGAHSGHGHDQYRTTYNDR